MFISKKELKFLRKRISALEKAEKERREKERYVKEHGMEGLEEAKKLLNGR